MSELRVVHEWMDGSTRYRILESDPYGARYLSDDRWIVAGSDELSLEISRLAARVEELERKRGSWIIKENDDLRAENNRLRELLRLHGQHLDDCNTIMGWGEDCPCDCGLAAALQEPTDDA